MMFRTTFHTLLILMMLISPFAQAQFSTFQYTVDGQSVDMPTRLKSAKVNGMSVAIIRNFEIDTLIYVGMADALANQAVNANTLFQAGSLTVPFTSILVVKAAQDGLIDLDTDINTYLTRWQLPNKHTDNGNDPVTVKDLLTKKRGFKLYSKPAGYLPGESVPTMIQVLNGEGPANNKPVQLRSNTHQQDNYSWETEAILMVLLEDVYQQEFTQLVEEHIFQVLGMKNAYLTAELSADQAKNAAAGYDLDGQEIEGKRRIYPELGNAGLWCSAEDYARFMIDLMKSAQADEGKILSQKWAKEAIKSHHNGKSLLCNYMEDLEGFTYGGASKGFRTQMAGNPENGTGIVLLMNSNENWRFMAETQWGMIDHYQLRPDATTANK